VGVMRGVKDEFNPDQWPHLEGQTRKPPVARPSSSNPQAPSPNLSMEFGFTRADAEGRHGRRQVGSGASAHQESERMASTQVLSSG